MTTLIRGGPAAKRWIASAAMGLCLAGPTLAQPAPPAAESDLVAQGRYLATLGGCGDCHTAKAGAYAGGRPFESPMGAVVSANITPDPETGIGAWNADDFYRALHEGKSRKVGHLYPAFPYPHFTQITRSDADALFAFLRSQPPVTNDPKRDQLSFPLNIRATMAFWNGLFFHKGTFQPDARRDAQWNRGAYVVEALAHCSACHSPKNALQAEVRSKVFQGGDVEGWFAPNLTPEPRTGLGRWSQQDIVDFLKTGRNSRTVAGGPMAGVVMGSTSHMRDEDLQAIAAYLTTLPASPPAPQAPHIDAAAVQRGGAVFTANCSRCHGDQGGGGRGPALDGDAIVQAEQPSTILHYIVSGTKAPATANQSGGQSGGAQMPAFGQRLDDGQIADVASYIRGAWTNRAASVTSGAVAKLRAKAQAQAGPS